MRGSYTQLERCTAAAGLVDVSLLSVTMRPWDASVCRRNNHLADARWGGQWTDWYKAGIKFAVTPFWCSLRRERYG